MPKKGGLGQFADLRGLAKKRGWCFLGGREGVRSQWTLWMLALHFQLVHTFMEQMPWTIPEWNKLDLQLRDAKSFKKFGNNLFKLGRPTPGLIYRIHYPLALKLLTRLRLGFSQFNTHNFKNCVNLLCTCSLEVQSTKHFFPNCHHYSSLRISFLNDLNNISLQFALLPKDVFVKTLLYGNPVFDENENQKILQTSIRYILYKL